jgi:hypothetical protein
MTPALRFIFTAAGVLALAACRASVQAAAQPEVPAGQVPLELVNRICSDSATIGDVVPARVLASNTAGGLFAQLALRGIDIASGIFRFEVVALTALSNNMAVHAAAASAPMDAERLPHGRLCVPARATLQAKIADDLVRFPRDP